MDPLYHAETDMSELCSLTELSKYRSLLGSANWVTSLGCFDIDYAIKMLAQYCVAPRKGHLEALQHVFGYLKHHPQGMILINSSDSFCRQHVTFHRDCDWSEYFLMRKKIFH